MLLWAIVGIMLIGVVLLDAFETVVLPRRATSKTKGGLRLWPRTGRSERNRIILNGNGRS